MPLVRISLLAGKPESHKRKVSDAVHRALVETISLPAQDRFQIIPEHANADFIYDPEYLNVRRTNDLVIIQITMSAGRTLEVRKSLYHRITDLLHQEQACAKKMSLSIWWKRRKRTGHLATAKRSMQLDCDALPRLRREKLFC